MTTVLTINGAPAASVPTTETVTSAAAAPAISADEIALYDRQIRLWGVQAQERIRTANILLITIKSLANEVAKNLVLAGIGSLTIVDHELVTEDDVCSQFFISEQDIGKNRAEASAPQIQRLNNRVLLHVDTSDIKTKDPSFYQAFDVVIGTELDLITSQMINSACRLYERPYYATSCHGMYGYVFADLVTHDFVIEREKPNKPTILGPETMTRSVINIQTKKEKVNGKSMELVTKRELYSPLHLVASSPLPADILRNNRTRKNVPPLLTCLRALWQFEQDNLRLPSHAYADIATFTTLATEIHKQLQLPMETLRSEFLRSFLQNIGSELPPVTAVLGGVLAQDVINILGAREQPLQNFLLFDGDETKAPILSIHPVPTPDESFP